MRALDLWLFEIRRHPQPGAAVTCDGFVVAQPPHHIGGLASPLYLIQFTCFALQFYGCYGDRLSSEAGGRYDSLASADLAIGLVIIVERGAGHGTQDAYSL